ncbi:S8 family serine peptidase [Aquimarina sp. Aq78]|uniref:S8 family peptidase n=1 Tax=Aquimarina sp. Aq78 TaxID=1191889 RepID=UPI00131AADE6|nr:S8 family serine peptidase [Aquimarina sp. Aq78]
MITSCKDDNGAFLYEDASKNQDAIGNNKSNIHSIKIPKQLKNELIVEFTDTTTEADQNALRQKYNVIDYKACNCDNKRVQKWVFDQNSYTEGRKDDIAQEGGVEGTDYQFYYYNENITPNLIPTGQPIGLINSSIRPVNDINPVTIAIIDTGIDLNMLQNTQPFLYNNGSQGSSCNTNYEISGWDFVNHDNNMFDDNGHGTIVADIIMKKLKDHNINDYQILALKAFDKDGAGTTFDILCSYLYAVSKPEVSVINMSFGWYQYPSDLLSKFINVNTNILHLTSAGNSDNDNDNLDHFPSSIYHNNVLSIGSYHEHNNYLKKSNFSNYGIFSVDFLSKGEKVSFYNHTVEGTSFAAPFVAAKAMKYYLQGYRTPQQMVDQLRINAHILNNENPLSVRFKDRVIK